MLIQSVLAMDKPKQTPLPFDISVWGMNKANKQLALHVDTIRLRMDHGASKTDSIAC